MIMTTYRETALSTAAMHTSAQVLHSALSRPGHLAQITSNSRAEAHKDHSAHKGQTLTSWNCYDQEYVKLALAALNVRIPAQFSAA